MSKTPSLLSGCNGKPLAYQASRKVNCFGCGTSIAMNEQAVQIPMKKGMRVGKKIHCLKCLSDILEQTKKDMAKIERLIPLA